MHGRKMTIQYVERDREIILKVENHVGGAQTVLLCRRLESLAGNTRRRIIVDLSGVSSIDSYGLGGLVFSQRMLEKQGKSLVIVAAEGHVKKAFSQCNLDRVLTIVDTLDQATL